MIIIYNDNNNDNNNLFIYLFIYLFISFNLQYFIISSLLVVDTRKRIKGPFHLSIVQ